MDEKGVNVTLKEVLVCYELKKKKRVSEFQEDDQDP